eukprot:gene35476-26924_t
MKAASGDDNGQLIVWSPDTGEAEHRLSPAHTSPG